MPDLPFQSRPVDRNLDSVDSATGVDASIIFFGIHIFPFAADD